MKTFFRDSAIVLLSGSIMAGFFLSCLVVLKGEIKTSDPNVLLLIGSVIGNINAIAVQVVSYWFGSSRGSADKDKAIANMSGQQ